MVVGHHADDQIETILMRLVRGSTGSGFSGMRPVREMRFGQLIRPFLEESKTDILAYAHEHNLPYCVDETNRSPLYTRNRFRENIIPLLRKENPRLYEHFSRFSSENQSDMDFLAELAQQKFTELGEVSENHAKLSVTGIKNLPFLYNGA